MEQYIESLFGNPIAAALVVVAFGLFVGGAYLMLRLLRVIFHSLWFSALVLILLTMPQTLAQENVSTNWQPFQQVLVDEFCTKDSAAGILGWPIKLEDK